MLSLHEVATLMLVMNGPDGVELDRADLEALVEHRLLHVETLECGHRRPCVTTSGHAVLDAITHVR